MDVEIQKAVESGTLTSQAGEALKALAPGTFCQHKSWGFGKIGEIDFLTNEMTIDFTTKKGHTMELQYAAESLRPLANDHLHAQKTEGLEKIKARLQESPVEIVRQILSDCGGKATQDQITRALVPDVLDAAGFKKWWDKTKKILKKDGHFAMPSKKSEPIELRTEALSRADELLAEFANARRLKDQTTVLDQIAKNVSEFSDPASQLAPIISKIEETAKQAQRLHTAAAFELLALRDEICTKANLSHGELTLAQMLEQEERQMHEVLPQIAAVKQKRILAEMPKAFGDDWERKALALMQKTKSARVVAEIARVLQDNDCRETLRNQLNRWIRDHSITAETLYWLCKERRGAFGDLVTPEVLSAILTAIERDQFSETKRGSRLHDLLMEDRELIPELIDGADVGIVRDAMRKLILTTAFEELNKRSLYGRFIRAYPELQSMLTGDVEQKHEALVVSWASLEKRKTEYEELVNKKIPQNTKDISTAREHGDLRENFEFKSAKEMQSVLMRRKSETEHDLERARGTNFENPDTTQASIGTIVTVENSENGETTDYTILGAWDGIPEERIISYLTAIGQSLLGKRAGEEIELQTESGVEKVKILSITAYAAVKV